MTISIVSFARSKPSNLGFMLDKTHRSLAVYEHRDGSRLILRRYRTSIEMDPANIKPEHRLPLMEMSRNYFQSAFGIVDWKIEKYDLQRGREGSTIVHTSGKYRSKGKTKFFYERHFHIGKDHYQVLLVSSGFRPDPQQILNSLGPIRLMGGGRSIASAGGFDEDSGTELVSDPTTGGVGAVTASLEQAAATLRIQNESVCEHVSPAKRNNLTRRMGLADESRANFWDFTGGAVLSCVEGFGQAIWDTLVGIGDLAVMGWDCVAGGKCGQALGSSLADYAEANAARLAGADGRVSFWEALSGAVSDSVVSAWDGLTQVRKENIERWKVELSKEEIGTFKRLYGEYIATGVLTSTSVAIAERTWNAATQIMKPVLDVIQQVMTKEYRQFMNCLTPLEQSKYICRTAGLVIETLGGFDRALAKVASGVVKASTVMRAAEQAARGFIHAPPPRALASNRAITNPQEARALSELGDDAWRRLPSGEQVAVVGAGAATGTAVASGAGAAAGTSGAATLAARSAFSKGDEVIVRHTPTQPTPGPQQNANRGETSKPEYSYTRVGDEGPYRDLGRRIQSGEVPLSPLNSPRVDDNPFARTATQTPEEFVRNLSSALFTNLEPSTMRSLNQTVSRHPEYGEELGRALEAVSRSSDPDVRREASHLFQRVAASVARSDQDLPNLDLVSQAARSGNDRLIRQTSELFGRVNQRLTRTNASIRPPARPRSFDEELDVLAREKLGADRDAEWQQQRQCLVGAPE